MLTVQRDLFDARTPVYNAALYSAPHSGSETSKAAADSITPSAATLRGMVYDWLLSRGELGGTDDEIQRALDMPGDTERPRRQELQKAGLVVKTDRTRLTVKDHQAAVWVAKKFADMPPPGTPTSHLVGGLGKTDSPDSRRAAASETGK